MEQGAPLLWVQPAPTDASPATRPPAPSRYPSVSVEAVMADFARRLANLEGAVRLSVPNDRIISAIQLTRDTAIISSDKIGLVGEVTFFDWHRDVTGAATGVIDPSITQIRGGTIRTEKILSFDGQSWIDLDAAGATEFIRGKTAISIYADGTFRFGGASNKNLVWNGTNLSIDGQTLIAGTAAGTIAGNAADALAGLDDKLARNSADTLSGVISVASSSSAGIKVGTITWDSSGNLTGGTGVAITSNGIVGAASGVAKFVLKGDGTATFAGELSAATGTFAGDISTTGHLIVTGATNTGGINAAGYFKPASGAAVYGEATTDFGLWGVATNAAGFGAYLNNSAGGYSLVTGTKAKFPTVEITASTGTAPMTISSTTLISNLNADKLDGYDAATLPIDLSQISIGSTGTKFQVSTDNATWVNYYFKRTNW